MGISSDHFNIGGDKALQQRTCRSPPAHVRMFAAKPLTRGYFGAFLVPKTGAKRSVARFAASDPSNTHPNEIIKNQCQKQLRETEVILVSGEHSKSLFSRRSHRTGIDRYLVSKNYPKYPH